MNEKDGDGATNHSYAVGPSSSRSSLSLVLSQKTKKKIHACHVSLDRGADLLESVNALLFACTTPITVKGMRRHVYGCGLCVISQGTLDTLLCTRITKKGRDTGKSDIVFNLGVQDSLSDRLLWWQ